VISQTAEYALRAIVFLGGNAGRPATTQQIAAATRVPVGYLSKVLRALGKAGLVAARRGLHGGFVLTRSLDDLTVLDVVNAVDPLRRIEHCPLGLDAHRGSLCSLHKRLDDGIAMIETYFRASTIAQLIAAPSLNNALCEVPRVEEGGVRSEPPGANHDGVGQG
jgi:Rrf2 family nitric oxide-sensitive transcriptional repressor